MIVPLNWLGIIYSPHCLYYFTVAHCLKNGNNLLLSEHFSMVIDYFLFSSRIFNNSLASSLVFTLINMLTGLVCSIFGSIGGFGMHIIETLFFPCLFMGNPELNIIFNRMLPGI